jgi:hypothetical protein
MLMSLGRISWFEVVLAVGIVVFYGFLVFGVAQYYLWRRNRGDTNDPNG